MRWLDTAADWQWSKRCWHIVLRGAGMTPRYLVMLPFSFGPSIRFWIAFECAVELESLVFPAGEPGGNIPATRKRIESSWDARVFDHCGMTEIGA